jgi:excisionase family DNA binding protein
MSDPDLLTVKQVAAELRVHPLTVRRRMAAGEFGDIYRDGRKCVRIKRAGYDAYIERRTEKTTNAAPGYTCSECGYTHDEKFAICPECGEEWKA